MEAISLLDLQDSWGMADGPPPTLLDLPEAALAQICSHLALPALFAASSTCTRLYTVTLPLFSERRAQLLVRGQPNSKPGQRASKASSSAAGASRESMRQDRIAVARHLRSACTHCGTIPNYSPVKEHAVNPRWRLCRQCAKLDDYKMLTLENAESYGLLKTDLRSLPHFRETKKVPGKGHGGRWKTYVWYCLQDVEGRAEELFGQGWRDRADFLSHEG